MSAGTTLTTIRTFLEGKKTYLGLIVFAIVAIVTGQDSGSGAVLGMSPDAIKELVAAQILAGLKAAFDRLAKALIAKG